MKEDKMNTKKELKQQNALLRVAFKKNKMKNKKLVKVLEKIFALELNKNTCNSGYLAINWAGLALEEIKEQELAKKGICVRCGMKM